jgi:hypothetical protein
MTLPVTRTTAPQPERGFWADRPKSNTLVSINKLTGQPRYITLTGPMGSPMPVDPEVLNAPAGTPFPQEPKPKIRRHSPAPRRDFRFLVWDISIWRRPNRNNEEI